MDSAQSAAVRYTRQMPFSVLTWYGARRARKPLHELVQFELSDRPTLLALVGDKFTQESHIRPFRPLAERFGERLHVILCAEWETPHREQDGELLFKSLGVAADVRPRLLQDEGETRCALFLRQRIPLALIDLYFIERGMPGMTGMDDGREPFFLAREEVAAREVERLMARAIPPLALAAAQAAQEQQLTARSAGLSLLNGGSVKAASRPALPPLATTPASAPGAGTHDFNPAGGCRSCGDNRLSLRSCPGRPKDDGPRRDRFELIELE